MKTSPFILLTALALGAMACKKDEPAPTPAPTPSLGTVRMSFTFLNGTTPFDINTSYLDGAGNTIRFNTLKFYVSGIHLKDDNDNTIKEFDDVFLLVDGAAADNAFTLGTMAAGHIHDAHFALGLDAVTNHADPTIAPYPLNIPGMHWSWNPAAGYKFLNMEGKVDGNGDGDFDDPEDTEFVYHCATDALLTPDHIHSHADLTAGGTATLAAKVDVQMLVMGLDFAANGTAMGGGPNNQQAMTNLAAAISGM